MSTSVRTCYPGSNHANTTDTPETVNTKANVRLELGIAGRHAPPGTDPASPLLWLTRDLVSRIAKGSVSQVHRDLCASPVTSPLTMET